MDLQNRYQRRQRLIVLLLILKAIIENKKYWEIQTRITNNYHLLAFTHMTNATIPFILSLPENNIRAQRQPRPKTEGFWTNVFPFLVDEGGYNSFRRHFRITLATFHAIVTRLETHPVFISDASNATPVWKQIAIVLWRLANGTGIRVLVQTFGVSQGSVSHFTDRFLKALLYLEQKRITWLHGYED